MMTTAIMKLMTQTIDGGLILRKMRKRTMKLWPKVSTQNVSLVNFGASTSHGAGNIVKVIDTSMSIYAMHKSTGMPF